MQHRPSTAKQTDWNDLVNWCNLPVEGLLTGAENPSRMNFDPYSTGTCYDEYFEATGKPRPGVAGLVQAISNLGEPELRRRQQVAERA